MWGPSWHALAVGVFQDSICYEKLEEGHVGR
jgi:hypothetical protein